MSSSIQRPPNGLLELVGAKSNGIVPNMLLGDVRATIDLLRFFGLVTQAETNNAALTEGSSVLLTVPNDQFWLMFAASVHVSLSGTETGVAASVRIGDASNFVAGAPAICTGYLNPTNTAGAPPAGNVVVCAWASASPMVLAPGTSIIGSLDVLGNDANTSVSIRARYSPLD